MRVARSLLHVLAGIVMTIVAGGAPAAAADASDLAKMRTPVAPQGPGWVKLDVPYVPTSPAVIEAMMKVANVGPDDIVYDLGSGDGRIPIAAVLQNKAKQAVGIELNPNRVADAVANAQKMGVQDRVTFIEGDVFKVDFHAATVVTMYLLDNVNLRLRPRILDELAPGTRIVSHQFHMSSWAPDQTVFVNTVPIHFWVVPAKLGGRWTGDGVSLDLEQQFQFVTGTLVAGGTSVTIGREKINGTDFSFHTTVARGGNSAAVNFHGKVDGDVLTGTLLQGGIAKDVTLTRKN